MPNTAIRCLEDLLAAMQIHLSRFEAERDNRCAFLRVYFMMTQSVRERMTQGFFLDAEWVERVAVRFAWWYFDALERFERGQEAPPAWEYAFGAARSKRSFLIQDILLGMNAHINNDLPMVVAEILHAEGDAESVARCRRRRFDHDQINRVLQLVIPQVEEEIAARYGWLVKPLNRLMGTLDTVLATYGLKTWRDTVWRNAEFLLGAETEPERRRIIHFIQEDALNVAQEIGRFPVLKGLRPLAPLLRHWHMG